MENKKKLLDSHSVIGWDIDETLINGPYSEQWRQYVLDNPDKHHYLITFRSKEQTLTVWNELSSCSVPLKKEHFGGILYMPDNIRTECYNLPGELRFLSYKTPLSPSLKVILKKHNLEWDNVHSVLKKVGFWKGSACKGIGASVLIDDLENVVSEGCAFYGIDFINSVT